MTAVKLGLSPLIRAVRDGREEGKPLSISHTVCQLTNGDVAGKQARLAPPDCIEGESRTPFRVEGAMPNVGAKAGEVLDSGRGALCGQCLLFSIFLSTPGLWSWTCIGPCLLLCRCLLSSCLHCCLQASTWRSPTDHYSHTNKDLLREQSSFVSQLAFLEI